MPFPTIGKLLEPDHINLLSAFSKSCRHTAISMVKNAQSGHPGGSLSSLDYLAILYAFIISQTGEKTVISNGHISPAVYSILAELGYISKQEVIEKFRKFGSIFEGHITRHVDGIWYGTGPLGIGVSAAAGFALSEKLNKTDKKVFALMGDGEAQEGQVHEMIHFANKYKLNNFIVFVDYNQVQLSDSLEEIMPIDIPQIFKTGNWNVLEIDGHNFQEIWKALGQAYKSLEKPVAIIGHTIMGKGTKYMEEEGKKYKSVWHGKAPSHEQGDLILKELSLTDEQTKLIEDFKKNIQWKPPKPEEISLLKIDENIKTGDPLVYEAGVVADCRGAYGKALLELAKINPEIIALTADLRESVKTDGVAKEFPGRHIETGIAEQNMISVAGGLSLSGFIPFASTFGVFMTSRGKDQVRVNDINRTNVKMVATHCGLSVGEDGPTHQAIDDMGSFLGFFNTMIIEPADANQTDRIIRYIAKHYGNFYVRMGRHKFSVILKEDGSIFYDKNYEYYYGRCDLIREGTDITIAASGACIGEALKARESLKKTHPKLSIEIVAVSSIKKFDQHLIDSIRKTQNIITVEDHNVVSGLGAQIAHVILENNIPVKKFHNLGVREYQLSGTADELYDAAGISAKHIEKACREMATQ